MVRASLAFRDFVALIANVHSSIHCITNGPQRYDNGFESLWYLDGMMLIEITKTQEQKLSSLNHCLLSPVQFKSTKLCKVTSGRWISPFSGNTIYNASEIDIGHVVPLKWSWDRGSSLWTDEKREQFANDPANLLSVEASLNRQKGAKGLVNGYHRKISASIL